ncbi:unnamed protein product [Meloidogyne enterolobii]|uniref:Uncharacterized protein n=1 Tax=Meloidogyne enterolobii TaxID=390850 RepID=A0ACB0XZC7_MELEN
MFLQLFFVWNRAHRRTVNFRVFTQFLLFRACSFSLAFFPFILSYQNTYNALPTNYNTNITTTNLSMGLAGQQPQPSNLASTIKQPTPLASIQPFRFN